MIFVAAVGIGLSARLGRPPWGVAIVLLAIAVPRRCSSSVSASPPASSSSPRASGWSRPHGRLACRRPRARRGGRRRPRCGSSSRRRRRTEQLGCRLEELGSYSTPAGRSASAMSGRPTTTGFGSREAHDGPARAPRAGARYWRASTLDAFEGRRWVEYLFPLRFDAPRGRLPVEALLPPSARDETGWCGSRSRWSVVQQSAARGEHTRCARVVIVGPRVVPAAASSATGRASHPASATRSGSHVPRPQPRNLAASRPRYPEETARYLTLSAGQLPPFGASSCDEGVSGVLSSPYHKNLLPYRAVAAGAA